MTFFVGQTKKESVTSTMRQKKYILISQNKV